MIQTEIPFIFVMKFVYIIFFVHVIAIWKHFDFCMCFYLCLDWIVYLLTTNFVVYKLYAFRLFTNFL